MIPILYIKGVFTGDFEEASLHVNARRPEVTSRGGEEKRRVIVMAPQFAVAEGFLLLAGDRGGLTAVDAAGST
jgi:hypothetical protein